MSIRRWFPRRRRPPGWPPGGVPCVEVVERVTEYLEDALPPPDRTRFETHLAGCIYCTAYVAQMRMTLRLVGQIEREELDPKIERGLLDAFKDWKAGGG